MLWFMLACSSPEPAAAPPPAATPAVAPAPDPALAAAGAAGQEFGTRLKGRLQEAMAAGGPPEGIDVCTVAAPAIAAEVRTKHGVKLGRSSLRLRNPGNVGPDWVMAWLRETGERPAEGLAPVKVVVDGTARVLVPIAVEPVCVTCHGPAEGLAPEVKAALAATYPQDAATGYAVGDLRGALWVEAPAKGG